MNASLKSWSSGSETHACFRMLLTTLPSPCRKSVSPVGAPQCCSNRTKCSATMDTLQQIERRWMRTVLSSNKREGSSPRARQCCSSSTKCSVMMHTLQKELFDHDINPRGASRIVN